MSAAYRCDLCGAVFDDVEDKALGAISIDSIHVHGGVHAEVVDICPSCAPRLRAVLGAVLEGKVH